MFFGLTAGPSLPLLTLSSSPFAAFDAWHTFFLSNSTPSSSKFSAEATAWILVFVPKTKVDSLNQSKQERCWSQNPDQLISILSESMKLTLRCPVVSFKKSEGYSSRVMLDQRIRWITNLLMSIFVLSFWSFKIVRCVEFFLLSSRVS